MYARDFNVGDRIHIPSGSKFVNPQSRYSTVLYKNTKTVLMRPEAGSDFIVDESFDDFELFVELKSLEELGDDLVFAIENANYEDGLEQQTLHMRAAIINWKERRAQ